MTAINNSSSCQLFTDRTLLTSHLSLLKRSVGDETQPEMDKAKALVSGGLLSLRHRWRRLSLTAEPLQPHSRRLKQACVYVEVSAVLDLSDCSSSFRWTLHHVEAEWSWLKTPSGRSIRPQQTGSLK